MINSKRDKINFILKQLILKEKNFYLIDNDIYYNNKNNKEEIILKWNFDKQEKINFYLFKIKKSEIENANYEIENYTLEDDVINEKDKNFLKNIKKSIDNYCFK